jgi:uncharacterized integral membrane protein
MNETWHNKETLHKAKIWTKLIVLGLLVLFIALFVLENYSRSVDLWFLRVHTMSVLELLVATFLAGVIATLLARPTYRTLRQIGELRKKPALPPVAVSAPPPPVPATPPLVPATPPVDVPAAKPTP